MSNNRVSESLAQKQLEAQNALREAGKWDDFHGVPSKFVLPKFPLLPAPLKQDHSE